ncbi:MAG TPA: VWA domain-containing protein [Pyrinomonadaceae bacterium]
MRKILALILTIAAFVCAHAQTQQNQQGDEDVVRITTQLIQVDAVVTDKNDQVIPDLKLSDFSLYENGKRQDLQFIEFVGSDSKPRVEGNVEVAGRTIEPEIARNLSAKDLHRVFAFVVDDLTIPFEDLTTVRKLLTDFVDNRMTEGDLVAIVRVVGGGGLLQQFTSDKQLLRRAIAELTPRTHPYSAFNNLDSVDRLDSQPQPATSAGGEVGGGPSGSTATDVNLAAPGAAMDSDVSLDGITRDDRATTTLLVAGNVIDSMKLLPGRKNMVLFSGGLSIFDSSRSEVSVVGAPVTIQQTQTRSNVQYLINQLVDRATRAGVAINTMDVRGIKANRGVSQFTDPGNEAKSALMTSVTDNSGTFGRVTNMSEFDNTALDTLTGHQGLQLLADATGGVSVINTSNFNQGLDRVVNRSSYYILAYKPNEPFDGKFHKLQIKVERSGAKVYSRVGYVAKADESSSKPLTKEQAVVRAAMSPLAKREVAVSGAFQYRFMPENRALIDVDLHIDASQLDFKQEADGKYHTTLEVVGFVVNRQGKTETGFSETIKAGLTPDEYKRALDNGLGYTGHVQLLAGTYQLRVAVREEDTGKLGSLSKYLEVPDMSKKRFTMSSIFLHSIDPSLGKGQQPAPLTALRQIPRKDDLRFSTIVYNPKVDKDKPQLNAQLILSRGDKIIFQQPVQTVDLRGSDSSQFVKVGQIGLSKLSPGHYVLTFIVTDALADKKSQTIARSIDFNIID